MMKQRAPAREILNSVTGTRSAAEQTTRIRRRPLCRTATFVLPQRRLVCHHALRGSPFASVCVPAPRARSHTRFARVPHRCSRSHNRSARIAHRSARIADHAARFDNRSARIAHRSAWADDTSQWSDRFTTCIDDEAAWSDDFNSRIAHQSTRIDVAARPSRTAGSSGQTIA